MNDQEKIMSVLAQGYQLLSKAMKLQPSKEGFLQVLLMLGDDGIQACVQVAELGPEIVAQTMAEVIQLKQTLKAEKGAKLNRIKALNDICPEGYMKKGGKCKKCKKGENLDPTKGVFHVTAYFGDGTNKGGINYYSPVAGTSYETLKRTAPRGSKVKRGTTSYGAPATIVERPGVRTNLGYLVTTDVVPDRVRPTTGGEYLPVMGAVAGAGSTALYLSGMRRSAKAAEELMNLPKVAPRFIDKAVKWGENIIYPIGGAVAGYFGYGGGKK